jgi:hypothetical protein
MYTTNVAATRYTLTARLFMFLALLCVPLGVAAVNLCVKSAASAAAVDGIVAPGLAGACASDALWQTVGPAQFQPAASSPVSYLYLARLTGANRLRIGIDTAGDLDVSNFDAVLLFFDANNSGTWDDQDFAIKVAVSPSSTVITSGDLCNQLTGNVEYYQRSGADWVSNAAAAASITARYAYDYSAPDTESNIWNLEIEIPINAASPFILNTVGPKYFAVGGYVFADTDHLQVSQQGQVRAWPLGVQSVLTGALPHVSAGAPGALLAVSEPDPTTLGNIELDDVCFDVNFSMAEEPWVINGNPSTAGDEHVRRHQNNNFRVTYYLDGPGTTATPISNPGDVKLGLRPFNGSGALAGYWYKTKAVGATPLNYNATHTVDFDFNFADPASPEFNDPSATFVCADAYLENFNLDDDKTNNNIHLNLNYFTTSEYSHALKLYGDSLPKPASGPIKKVYLQMEMSNEETGRRGAPLFALSGAGGTDAGAWGWARSLAHTAGERPWPALVLLLAGLGLAAGSLAYAARRGARGSVGPVGAALGVALMLGSIVTACTLKEKPDEKPGTGTARWNVANAKEIGLTAVKGRQGWYEMPMQRGETKALKLDFVGLPLSYQMKTQRLNPTRDGQPNKIDVAVKPGTVVTLLSFGEVDVDGKAGPLPPTTPMPPVKLVPPTTAAGFTQRLPAGLKRSRAARQPALFFGVPQALIGKATTVEDTRYRYPLTEGYYAPNEHTGALIGSFDGFKTSFVVGRHKSVFVPAQASTLSLAVNAMHQSYATMTGFYDVGVIFTPAPTVPTRTVPGGDATYSVPPVMQPWDALTSLNIYTFYEEELFKDGRRVSATLRPWGHAHYVLYASHAGTAPVAGTIPARPGP